MMLSPAINVKARVAPRAEWNLVVDITISTLKLAHDAKEKEKWLAVSAISAMRKRSSQVWNNLH